MQMHLRCFRHFVGVIDTGEILDLSRASFFIQPLGVALFRCFEAAVHLIVGRDHAGVGSYYGGFDAQTIFDDEVPEGALALEIYRADHTAFSKKLGRVVMMRDAPDHSPEDFVLLSGTKVREMLGQGIAPPPEFSRPEVAEILMAYYH